MLVPPSPKVQLKVKLVSSESETVDVKVTTLPWTGADGEKVNDAVGCANVLRCWQLLVRLLHSCWSQ